MLRPYTRLDAPQFDHVRADFDAKLLQQQLANRATGDPRHRLPGARPLEDVARVLAVVFQGAGQVGVSRPRPRDLAPAPPPPPPRADNNTRARLLVGLASRSPPGHVTAPVARATGW